MTGAADVCPECGAPRRRRAAGCAHCGHIFQDVPAAEARLPAARAPAAPAPHPEDLRAERGSGCGSCVSLLAICAVLTLIAGVVLYFTVRAEVQPLVEQVQRTSAGQDLERLQGALQSHARAHDGRLPAALDELDVPAGWRVDAWGTPIGYTPGADRRSARLTSFGADTAPGGEGLAADLERDVTVP